MMAFAFLHRTRLPGGHGGVRIQAHLLVRTTAMRIRWPSLVGCLIVARLVPGAALSKDEPAPLQGAVIVVDPGHGGQRYSKSYTGGTRGVNSRLTESELNLRVAVELAELLREKGATVYMTRLGDHRLSREGSSRGDELHARIDFFDHHSPHFFLSVHHNAGGGSRAGGHTALYKSNAKDDTLYKSLAQDVNDALDSGVPGPKNKLIGDYPYHILNQTETPGTISESGFMTNPTFDELSTKPEFPKKEAEAIVKGAIKYWSEHKDTVIALRAKLMKERAEHPRDPKTFTAIDLNPEFRALMKELLAKVAPSGQYAPSQIGTYIENFKKAVVTDPKATFTVKGEFDGERILLTGSTSDSKYHDQLIDVLIAMKLYDISNKIQVSKRDAQPPAAPPAAYRDDLPRSAPTGYVQLKRTCPVTD
jgi:N-acetylmuramoyl-L-alanine amidase